MRTSKQFQALTLAALSTLAGAAIAASASAPHQALLPARTGDQVPTRLVALPAPTAAIERKPVAFTWALDPSAKLTAATPFQASSREYSMTVDGRELARGVAVQTSAAGALIRISPARGATPLRAADLSVSAAGRKVGIASVADASALHAVGMDVSAGTQILRLGAGSGAGRQQLKAAHAHGRYVVHVFEPNSRVVLSARAARTHALSGDTLRVALGSAGAAAPLLAKAMLVAPDGSNWPVSVRATRDRGMEAVMTLPARPVSTPGLWELQVFGFLGNTPRDVRTAFAVAQPTARFAGTVGVDARNLRVTLPVQTGSVGRYEARATLYATSSNGRMAPVAEAHTAAWMGAGRSSLVLQFSRQQLPAGYGAPFELRDLQLNDQSRMAPLESRARALRF